MAEKLKGLMVVSLNESDELPQEFIDDPKGFMEKQEKEYQEHVKNMPLGNIKNFYSGVMEKPADKETKMQIFGEDFRNYLEFNRTSIPFMMLYDYFKEEK